KTGGKTGGVLFPISSFVIHSSFVIRHSSFIRLAPSRAHFCQSYDSGRTEPGARQTPESGIPTPLLRVDAIRPCAASGRTGRAPTTPGNGEIRGRFASGLHATGPLFGFPAKRCEGRQDRTAEPVE